MDERDDIDGIGGIGGIGGIDAIPATSARHERRSGRVERGVLSWTLCLLGLMAALVGSLLHIQAAGPGGVSAAGTPRSVPTQAQAASFSIQVGDPPKIAAVTAYLFDADTGLVLYTKNPDAERAMASTTKVMTALLAVEHGNLDQVITVGKDAAALVRPDSSYMGLSAGEKLTLRELLYGLLLPSGNDAAVAIADAIGGSVPQFVAMMNAKAVELGLTHTHYVTPHGLDASGHYTSARDLAVLGAVAMQVPVLRQMTSTLKYDIPKTSDHKAYHLVTGDDLIPGARSPYPGAIGIKPGYTGKAGYTMAFAAIRRGHEIVGAVLGDPSWQIRINDMRALLDYGYEQDGLPPAPAPVPWSHPSPDQ